MESFCNFDSRKDPNRYRVMRVYRFFFTFACLLFQSSILFSAEQNFSFRQPVVGIIIDDLGDNYESGIELIELPGALTYSFLPHTRYTPTLSQYAARLHKEVMVHMPMEPSGDDEMGPGGLTREMSEFSFLRMLRQNLSAVPHAIGVNNHMGSALTASATHMHWLMRELARQGDYYFVDSMTTRYSIASRVAQETSVPTIKREVFLDHERDLTLMPMYFQILIDKARDDGYAVAIAHPYPETIGYLRENIPRLEKLGITLVPISQIIELQNRRNNTWQASWSHSHKDAKNLKRLP